jgi:hypothetical protein
LPKFGFPSADRRIFAALHKLRATEVHLIQSKKVRNPKVIWLLYGYRQPIARNLASNLMALGLTKAPPKVKTLDEILSEEEDGNDYGASR